MKTLFGLFLMVISLSVAADVTPTRPDSRNSTEEWINVLYFYKGLVASVPRTQADQDQINEILWHDPTIDPEAALKYLRKRLFSLQLRLTRLLVIRRNIEEKLETLSEEKKTTEAFQLGDIYNANERAITDEKNTIAAEKSLIQSKMREAKKVLAEARESKSYEEMIPAPPKSETVPAR